MANRLWGSDTSIDDFARRWLIFAAFFAGLAAIVRQPLLVVLALILALIGLAIRFWWRFCFAGVSYRRRLSATRAFWGESVELELVAENAKPLPLLRMDVVEELSHNVTIPGVALEPAGPRARKLPVFFSLGLYERVHQRYTVPTRVRGRHRFGPASLTTSDPFGLVSKRMEVPGTAEFIVYPRMVPVTNLAVPARQPLGDDKPAQPLVEDPLRIAGVRPYVPGDSPRRIHWRATARTGALQTRIYEPSATPSVALFLDTNTFAYLWEGQNTALLELAITLTASLARDLFERRHAVGLFANAPVLGGRRSARVQPGRHPAQLTRLLEVLALLAPAFGQRIEEMIAAELSRLAWGTSIVVITCRVSVELQRALLRLSRVAGGQRFVLLAVGERPELAPELRRRVAVHHLSGDERWETIESIVLEAV
jgi:uncharacterized protein (DUF58 family)